MGRNIPHWVSRAVKRLQRERAGPTDRLLLGRPMRCVPQAWADRPARALALRRMLLPGDDGRGPAPRWLRQMAAVALGAVPRKVHLGAAAAAVDAAQTAALAPGSVLVAHVPRRGLEGATHCEARIFDRLSREPAHALEGLSPLVFYSVKCPCQDCAEKIARFATRHPSVSVEIAYEQQWVPEAYADSHGGGYSDASAVATMRAAGVSVATTEQLIWCDLVDTIEGFGSTVTTRVS